MNDEKMTIRDKVEWMLNKIQKEDSDEKKMKVIYTLICKVYAGERF